jgi:hypothetical protein
MKLSKWSSLMGDLEKVLIGADSVNSHCIIEFLRRHSRDWLCHQGQLCSQTEEVIIIIPEETSGVVGALSMRLKYTLALLSPFQ